MKRPALEVADIVRAHGAEFGQRHPASCEQRRALGAIEHCRTATLGAHRERCDQCGHEVIAYNSCRNGHCPKCQGSAQTAWVDKKQADLLPAPYFHLVFTLPEELAPLAMQNQWVIHDLLFHTAWDTLRTIAADPRHLGAQIGTIAVLHTWGQTLTHHPHLDCVVPGSGLYPDVEGLPGWPVEAAHAKRRRIPPPLPAARSARWIRADQALRPALASPAK